MKKYLFQILIIVTGHNTFAQNSYSTCKKANTLVKEFEKFHFKPIVINEKVSSDIFDDFIKSVDYRGLYLTKDDLDALTAHRTQLGIQINKNSCNFLDAFIKLYKQKLILADTFISQLTNKPFDFNSNESFDYNSIESELITLTANDTELKTKWLKFLKYNTLNALLESSVDTKNTSTADNKLLLKDEALMRNKTKIIYKRRIQRIIEAPEGFENYIGSIFLNCIANRFDPHSTYFTPTEKDKFMELVSKDKMSYGFYTGENDNGDIEIKDLVPGGNAWKSNQINEGDILLKVKFENQKTIDLIFTDNYELDRIFNENSNAKTVEITIRKTNKQIKTVLLKKEKSEQDDNVVKSYILNGTKKIGYISLPSFYDDWAMNNPYGCGNDVAKEIAKLQSEKIDGLILDLRFNGGGSMYEAINLAGIFINEGPLAILKHKNEKPSVIKDMNRGTAYDGPLLVMVNGHSASASEMLSGVLQDYNRAIIVGSPTYGKATVQSSYPLDLNFDPKYASANATSDLGYTNITTMKFYRINATSHQKKGILPDIFLPELFYISEEKEAKEKFALECDTVGKVVNYIPLKSLPIATLNQKSKERMKDNIQFNKLNSLNDSIIAIDKQSVISLNFNDYKQFNVRLSSVEDDIDSIFNTTSTSYKVSNNNYDKIIFNVNDFSKQINDKVLDKIQRDIYLDESYKIMLDLINSK